MLIDQMTLPSASEQIARAKELRKAIYSRKPVRKPIDLSFLTQLPPASVIPPVAVTPKDMPVIQYVPYGDMRINPIVYKMPPLKLIAQRVCWLHGLRMEDFMSPRRRKEVRYARFHFVYLAKKYTVQSYPSMGRFMGGRDHTTMLHAFRRWSEIKANGYAEFRAAQRKVKGERFAWRRN